MIAGPTRALAALLALAACSRTGLLVEASEGGTAPDAACSGHGEIDVTIPRLHIEVAVTLAGAAPPVLEGTDRGRLGPQLTLVHTELEGSTSFQAYEPSGPRGQQVPRETIELALVPGEYEVHYRLGSTTAPFTDEWPWNWHAVIGRVLIERDGQRVDIDVPRARFDVTTTLGGAQPPRDWQPPTDVHGTPFVPAWVLEAESGARASIAICTWTEGDCVAHTAGWIVPDAYASRYSFGMSDDTWPMAEGWIAATPLALERETRLDVPFARVSFSTTLAGAPVPPGHHREGPSLWLRSANEDVRAVASLYEPQEDGELVPRATVTAVVLPDTYELIYQPAPAGSLATEWPVTWGVLARGVLVDGDRTIEVDVPRARMSITATLAGAPATDCARPPHLAVGGPSLGLPVDVPGAIVWMIPGEHEVVYRGTSGDCEGWPANDATLGSIVVPSEGASATIDVPRVRAVIDVLLSAAALPPIATGPASGRPALHLGNDHASGTWLQLYDNDRNPVAHHERWLLPGLYRVSYTGASSGAFIEEWPLGRAQLEMLDASTDVSMVVDIPRSQARVRVDVDGGASDDYVSAALVLTRGDPALRVELPISEPVDGESPPLLDRTRWFLPGLYTLHYEARMSEENPSAWPGGAITLCGTFRP